MPNIFNTIAWLCPPPTNTKFLLIGCIFFGIDSIFAVYSYFNHGIKIVQKNGARQFNLGDLAYPFVIKNNHNSSHPINGGNIG